MMSAGIGIMGLYFFIYVAVIIACIVYVVKSFFIKSPEE